MTKNPLVSVLLNSYNGDKYISQQIKSILNQTYKKIELIIYDDCSTDNTLKIAKKYKKNDKRIKIFQNKKNIGLIKSYKKGLRQTKGEYIALADNDNYWLKNKLKIQVSFIRKNRKYLAVFHDSYLCDDNLKVINSSMEKAIEGKNFNISKINIKDHSLKNLIYNNHLTAPSVLVDSSIKKYLLMNPQTSMHDYWIALVVSSISSIGYINKKMVKYRIHQNNLLGIKKYTNLFYIKSIFNKQWQTKSREAHITHIKNLEFLLKFNLTHSKYNNVNLIASKLVTLDLLIKILNSSNFFELTFNFIKSIKTDISSQSFTYIKYSFFYYFNKIFAN